MNLDTISGILEKYQNGHGGLIAILEEIQSVYSYLPREALEEVSRRTGRSLVDVYRKSLVPSCRESIPYRS